jgi:hypothetical protein
MASATTGRTITVQELADPVGLRPTRARHEEGRVGEHLLDNGQLVWETWKACSRTHVHIFVWDEDKVLATVSNICRLQAARTTEALLVALES